MVLTGKKKCNLQSMIGRNPLLIGSMVLTQGLIERMAEPPGRNPLLIGSMVLTYDGDIQRLYLFKGRNPLLIGSMVLTLDKLPYMTKKRI